MGKCKYMLVFLTIIAIGIGCASMGVNLDTPEKKYLGARAELNLLLEQYIRIQDKVSDIDHLAAKNAFLRADQVLDIWESKLGISSYDWQKDMMLWLDVKNVIVNILTEVM